MNTKQLFHSEKALREQWAAVRGTDWFERTIVYAKAGCAERGLTKDEMTGMRIFLEELMQLGAPEDGEGQEIPGPGLVADVIGTAKEDAKQKKKGK